MTRDKMVAILKGYIYSNYKNASEYADVKGFSRSFVSAVIVGKKNPNSEMLLDVGLTMKVVKITTFSKA
jgi:hypothetical protein|tara:strand:- start:399 stop:605 length:207 start_codon:yes stop_codon:yes gene_type:complete